MARPRDVPTDSLLRTAAWLYIIPKAVRGVVIFAVLALAGFMVITALALALAR